MSYTTYNGAHIARACTSKKGYPTEEIAQRAISSIRRSSPEADVCSYACFFCGLWHVGGAPKSVREAPVSRATGAYRKSRRNFDESYRRAPRDRRRRDGRDDDD